jgi:hypothetical protein
LWRKQEEGLLHGKKLAEGKKEELDMNQFFFLGAAKNQD